MTIQDKSHWSIDIPLAADILSYGETLLSHSSYNIDQTGLKGLITSSLAQLSICTIGHVSLY